MLTTEQHTYKKVINSSLLTSYTGEEFASKLTTDLGNNVTYISNGDDPREFSYLQFQNATSLTGIPTTIFDVDTSALTLQAGEFLPFRYINLTTPLRATTDVAKFKRIHITYEQDG
jgi:hypothetical protein